MSDQTLINAPATAMKMLFQMPNGIPQTTTGAEWRCRGCGASIRQTEHRLPTFCAFCRAWSQWQREGDGAWARALSGWEDDGGRCAGPFAAAAADR
jgi:hypothetical protein